MWRVTKYPSTKYQVYKLLFIATAGSRSDSEIYPSQSRKYRTFFGMKMPAAHNQPIGSILVTTFVCCCFPFVELVARFQCFGRPYVLIFIAEMYARASGTESVEFLIEL